jgi:HAD superfamily hydrolase (TIGR01490 family)
VNARGICFVDLDGTLISRSSEKELVLHMFRKGRLRLPQLVRFGTGYLAHPLKSLRQGKGWNRLYLKGLSEESVRPLAEDLATNRLSGLVRESVRDSVGEAGNAGFTVVLMSAALVYLAGPLRASIGAKTVVASEPEVDEGGRFTGRLRSRRPWGTDKCRIARELASEEGMEMRDCIAYGDSWSDRFLMQECGSAVAVHPGGKLLRLAKQRGWSVIPGRHTRWA